MKFIVGVATGIVIGAVGAVAYAVKSDQDLREAFQTVRSDIQKGDFDALGSRLESRFNELQAQLDQRMSQVRASTAQAIDEANASIDAARAAAAEDGAAAEAAGEIDDANADAIEEAEAETLEVAADDIAITANGAPS